VKYHPKHVQQLIVLNKLYSVASCWIIITVLHDGRSIEHKISANIFLSKALFHGLTYLAKQHCKINKFYIHRTGTIVSETKKDNVYSTGSGYYPQIDDSITLHCSFFFFSLFLLLLYLRSGS